jgi:SRSO17 transposase
MAVTETPPQAVAAAEAAIHGIAASLRRRFRRGAAHQHAVAYGRGLLSEVERKNGWQLAEPGGYSQPRTIQRVLDRSRWEADAVRADRRGYVGEHLGDADGVLAVDETGFRKQGLPSCGVARQYSGTAGRSENCQIGGFLGYSSAQGRAGIDRELYRPREWAEDAERRPTAGVPDPVAFHTQPQLALGRMERARDAGVPARWGVADAVYGSDSKVRRALEERDQAYVVAVKSNEKPSPWPLYGVPGQVAVAARRSEREPEAWPQLSCGEGAPGERRYDGADVPLRPARQDGWGHSVLFRRSRTAPSEIASSLVDAPEGTPLAELARAAGARWAIEDGFTLAKGPVGLDHYAVRSWAGWYRHSTVVLLALALRATSTSKRGTP